LICSPNRNATNGLVLPSIGGKTNSLLCALSYFGIPSISFEEKKEMQQLAARGGPWTDDERAALLAYCETDVNALELLVPRILSHVHVPFALHRGRYMKAAAQMEHDEIPIDVGSLQILRRHWPTIKAQLVAAVDVSSTRASTPRRQPAHLRDGGPPWLMLH
jgi:DNA polymerase-1